MKESGVLGVHSRATDIEVFKKLVTSLRQIAQRPEILVAFVKPILPPIEVEA